MRNEFLSRQNQTEANVTQFVNNIISIYLISSLERPVSFLCLAILAFSHAYLTEKFDGLFHRMKSRFIQVFI